MAEDNWSGNWKSTKGWKGTGKRTVENGGLTPSCLYIKFLTGKELMWPFSGMDATILEIKEWIQDREGIPPEQQRLVFAGKQLEDERTFEECNLEVSSTLHCLLMLREKDGGS